MQLGGDRMRKAKAQQLRREYEAIAFCDGEAIEDFALRLTSLVSQLAQVGIDIGEDEAVAKYLRVVPPRFGQIALSIEEVTGRLKAVEDRAEAPARSTARGQLLLTEDCGSHWAAQGGRGPRGGARPHDRPWPATAHGGAVGSTPARDEAGGGLLCFAQRRRRRRALQATAEG